MLSPLLYNLVHYTMVGSFLILSVSTPSLKMKIVGGLLTIVNFLLFLK